MILDEQVTYEFLSLEYDTCTRTYILAESDSDLYTFGLGTTNYSVLQQVTDEGAYQYTFTGLESDGNAFTTKFYQECSDVNGDLFYPEIRLSVTVQASESSDDSDDSDVNVLEFWDGDSATVVILEEESVTYEFQNLDYDTCTLMYVVDEPHDDYYVFDNFKVNEEVTDEGVYQYVFTGYD